MADRVLGDIATKLHKQIKSKSERLEKNDDTIDSCGSSASSLAIERIGWHQHFGFLFLTVVVDPNSRS